MNTLIVKYLPTGAKSNTKKLLDVFLSELKGKPPETLDLLHGEIPFFTEKSMAAYVKRNYLSQPLSPEETFAMKPYDALVKQFKSADVVVMAYPMHNFGMPGMVKTYLDAIMLKGETFEMGKKLMAGKRSLTLYTAGGQYPQDQVTREYPNWDTLTLNAKINFSFMGFDEAEVIGTSLRDPATAESRLSDVRNRVKALVEKWYL